MYFHLYFEDFLKKYLYLYFLIEKNSDFKYKYILFQKNKFSLLSHAKFYSVIPGGARIKTCQKTLKHLHLYLYLHSKNLKYSHL